LSKPLDRIHRNREHDAKRREEQPWRSWYKRQAWLSARAAQLIRQPLCERHLARGEIVSANTVHHRKPHKGDWDLFIDPENHEPLCASCHNSEAQREERGRPAQEIGEDGWPVG